MNKNDLLDKVRANRVRHHETYIEAVVAYRAKAAEWHRKQSEAASGSGPIERMMPARIPEPEDNTADYDAAIQMIEMAQADVITVDEEMFRQLVLDQWGWSDRWARTTSVYSTG